MKKTKITLLLKIEGGIVQDIITDSDDAVHVTVVDVDDEADDPVSISTWMPKKVQMIKTNLLIKLEGGIVQEIITDSEDEVKLTLIDVDTEDEEEPVLTSGWVPTKGNIKEEISKIQKEQGV
jgi:hypothetical protein